MFTLSNVVCNNSKHCYDPASNYQVRTVNVIFRISFPVRLKISV